MAFLPSLLQPSSPLNNSENEWNLPLCIWCRNLNLFCVSVYVLSYFFVFLWNFLSYMQLAVPLYSISLSLSSSHYFPPSYVSATWHLKSQYDRYSWYLQMLFSFCGTFLSSLHLAKSWLDLSLMPFAPGTLPSPLRWGKVRLLNVIPSSLPPLCNSQCICHDSFNTSLNASEQRPFLSCSRLYLQCPTCFPFL